MENLYGTEFNDDRYVLIYFKNFSNISLYGSSIPVTIGVGTGGLGGGGSGPSTFYRDYVSSMPNRAATPPPPLITIIATCPPPLTHFSGASYATASN